MIAVPTIYMKMFTRKVVKEFDNGDDKLIFRDTLKVNVDYGTIVKLFKLRLNENFFKGYIDKDETQLFYLGSLRRPLSVNLPLIQINFENKKTADGQIIIKIKIVNFTLILFGGVNISILVFSIIGLDPYSQNDNHVSLEVPLIVFMISYIFLLSRYLIELSEFKKEIKRLQ